MSLVSVDIAHNIKLFNTVKIAVRKKVTFYCPVLCKQLPGSSLLGDKKSQSLIWGRFGRVWATSKEHGQLGVHYRKG